MCDPGNQGELEFVKLGDGVLITFHASVIPSGGDAATADAHHDNHLNTDTNYSTDTSHNEVNG